MNEIEKRYQKQLAKLWDDNYKLSESFLKTREKMLQLEEGNERLRKDNKQLREENKAFREKLIKLLGLEPTDNDILKEKSDEQ
jgi:FtsZ-binding cell division protein ZapB